MSSASVLDAVARLLANDPTFLAFKGLQPTDTNDLKAEYIIKDEETDGVVTSDSIPICLVYTRPGRPDVRTTQVYVGKVVIDCFAHDSNTARLMCAQTMQLMQNWQPDDGDGSLVCRFAFDTGFKTGIPGVRAHRIFYDLSQFVG